MQEAAAFYKASGEMTIHFTAKSYWSATENWQSQNGSLFLGAKHAFRLETKGLVIVSDGQTMWKYNTAHEQVTIQDASAGLGSMHPSKVLFEFLNCEPISVQTQGKKNIVLTLHPSGGLKNFDSLSVVLSVKSKQPKEIFTTDAAENRWHYILNKMKTNVRHKKALFTFTPPKSAEVVDLR